MGFWKTLGRGALAISTGGLSEAIPYADKLLSGKPPDLKPVQQTAAEIANRRQEFAEAYKTYLPRQAAQAGPAAQAAVPNAPERQFANGPTRLTAERGEATSMGPVGLQASTRYDAPTLGGPGQAAAERIGGGDQMRGRQVGALDTLEGAAAGAAPSAAEAQLQRGTDANIRANFAMAKSAKGYGGIAAMLGAQQQQEQAGLDLASRTSELRANEMAQARGQYAQALGQARGQDIGAETTNAQLGADVSKFNAQQGQQMAIEQGRMTQQARADFAAASNQANLAQGQINLQTGIANQQASNDMSRFNAAQGNQVGQFNVTAGQQNQQFNAGLEATRQQFVAGQQGQIGMFNAGQTNQTNLAQLDADMRQRGLDDQQRRDYMNFILQSQGQSLDANLGTADRQRQAQQDRYGRYMDYIGLARDAFAAGAGAGG